MALNDRPLAKSTANTLTHVRKQLHGASNAYIGTVGIGICAQITSSGFARFARLTKAMFILSSNLFVHSLADFYWSNERAYRDCKKQWVHSFLFSRPLSIFADLLLSRLQSATRLKEKNQKAGFRNERMSHDEQFRAEAF